MSQTKFYESGLLEFCLGHSLEQVAEGCDLHNMWPDDDETTREFLAAEPTIALPHSCDRWLIGGIAEARVLISDLEDVIGQAETHQAKQARARREAAK